LSLPKRQASPRLPQFFAPVAEAVRDGRQVTARY
jgi:hypothetical protein